MKNPNQNSEVPKPDALLLDIDNTLYEYMPAHNAGTKAVGEKLHALYSVDPGDFEEAYEGARSVVKDRLGRSAASHNRLIYFKVMCEQLGFGAEPGLFLDLEQTYWREFLASAELFEGVKEFLDEVRLSDVPIFVVTDLTVQIQLRKLVFFSLEHLFDGIITSEEAGGDKVTGAPFELLRSYTKAANYSAFLMVGDSLESDISASREFLEAFTIQKIHQGVRTGRGAEKADVRVKSFAALVKLARQWN